MSRPFRDSEVVATTVRAVAPFALTFGLFTMFHGTSSVGGGFQGGVVIGAVVVTLGFTFGVEETGEALDDRLLTGAAVTGVVVFGVVAGTTLSLGGAFLELGLLPIPKPVVYGVEAIEIGIGVTVAAVIAAAFFRIAGVKS